MNRLTVLVFASLMIAPALPAETCTTQAALPAPERTTLADAARTVALAVQGNDVATLRASVTGDLQKNFGALQYLVAVTAPKLAGNGPQVEQLYLLDAATLKLGTDGSSPEAQFFCTLNNSSSETQFSISGLTAARYAFAMVNIGAPTNPWRLSMLLRQEGVGSRAKWLLAGIYPKALTIAGHDGLWFWKEARQYAQRKQPWNAWVFYQTAQTLLRPADFVQSTHLDKLHTEAVAAAPSALSDGLSPETPLVLKAPAGAPSPASPKTQSSTPATPSADLRFTGLSLADPLAGSTAPVLAVRLRADPLPDPAAARQRNVDAARALLAAYPELRSAFRTVNITTDSSGQPPLTTELQMADLH